MQRREHCLCFQQLLEQTAEHGTAEATPSLAGRSERTLAPTKGDLKSLALGVFENHPFVATSYLAALF